MFAPTGTTTKVVLCDMRLYDTKQRAVVKFEPPAFSDPTLAVTMYTCGITPYDAAHLGHLSTYVFYDILQRRLRDMGLHTRCVRNVTDIDDPLFAKAKELGVDWKELGDRELAKFWDAMRQLSVLPAAVEPRASDAIADVLGLVSEMVKKNHAYASNGYVYFDVTTWKSFGELSHYSHDEMLRIFQERGGNIYDSNKRNPLDFVLWQPSGPGEPSWPSRWGKGRPGWHIECSALALRELGITIDLHGGGSDLIFPHHECEDAQSVSVTSEPFVRHWMHVAMVYMNGEKMSKSLGNLVFAQDLLSRADASAVRLLIANNHYRKDWEWEEALLAEATARLNNWRASVGGRGAGDAYDNSVVGDVRCALDEDLNTPLAAASIDTAAAKGFDVSEAAMLLGILV